MNNNRIVSIDIIKCICIVWLVGIWHLSDYMSNDSTFVHYIQSDIGSYFTKLALHLFTFFSGYFAAVSIINHNFKTKDFYIHKLLRIYPLFVIAALTLYIIPEPWSGGAWMNKMQLWSSLIGLGIVFPPAPNTLWFLDMILLFYILTPFILSSTALLVKILKIISIFFIACACIKLFGLFDGRFIYYCPSYFLGLLIVPYISDRFPRKINRESDKKKCLIIRFSIFICCAISESCMVAYLFHRQIIYYLHTLFGIPLMMTAAIVFICSYYIYVGYNAIIKKIISWNKYRLQ